VVITGGNASAVSDDWTERPGKVGCKKTTSQFGLGIFNKEQSLGLLSFLDDKGWKQPTKEDEVVRRAKAHAEQVPGCCAFAVSPKYGVQFYSKECYGSKGSLDDDPKWTCFTRGTVAEEDVTHAHPGISKWHDARKQVLVGAHMQHAARMANDRKDEVAMKARLEEERVKSQHDHEAALGHTAWLNMRDDVQTGAKIQSAARKAEITRLAAVAAAEEAKKVKKVEAERRAQEAETARLAAQRAAEEVEHAMQVKAAAEEAEKKQRMKSKARARWGESRQKVITGAKMAHTAKAALAVKLTLEAEKARVAAVAAERDDARLKAEEEERRLKLIAEADERSRHQAKLDVVVNTSASGNTASKSSDVRVAMSTMNTTATAAPAVGVSVMSVQSQIQATDAETVLDDGTRIVTMQDGTIVQYNVDGTVITTYADGTVFQKNPDGVEITIKADGTRIQQNPDGAQIFTLITGVTITTHADGSKSQVDPHTGIQIDTMADGVVRQTNADGVVIVTYLDGSTLQTHLDGSTIKTGNDGIQHGVRSDGSKYTILLDGTLKEEHVQAPMSVQISAVGMGSAGMTKSLMMFENNSTIINITSEEEGLGSYDVHFFDVRATASVGTVETLSQSSDGVRQLKFTPPKDWTGCAVIKYVTVLKGGRESVQKEMEVHVSKAFVSGQDKDKISFQLDVSSLSGESDDDEGPGEAAYGLWRVSC